MNDEFLISTAQSIISLINTAGPNLTQEQWRLAASVAVITPPNLCPLLHPTLTTWRTLYPQLHSAHAIATYPEHPDPASIF